MAETMFRFGCGHVKVDPELHEASWGARLIYAEVVESRAGHTPVVYDRQTPDGDPEAVRLLFPVIDRAIDEFRTHRYELPADSRGELCWRDGRALVVMSPQGSYGYLYVTALLEREGHENETRLADFEGKIEPREFPRLGNWPPEVVAAREERERKEARERVLGDVKWTAQDARWAQRDVWGAKTERTKTIREKKARKADEAAAAARQAALAFGFSEAEVDDAARGY